MFSTLLVSDTVKDNPQLNSKKTSALKANVLLMALIGGVLTLSGCATKPSYQVNRGPTVIVDARGVPNYYKVKSGDTVSHIANRYGLNYRRIGAMNRLDSRYTIYSGQWLKLWEGKSAPSNRNNVATAQPKRTYPSNQSAVTGTTSTPNIYNGTNNSPIISTKGYGYPTTSPVFKNFDANAGVNSMWFGGRLGDPIVASKEGQVLYSGNGLPEYGNLIMIRHDEKYITVYAHNDKLLVKEGDQVRAGQQIATMGNTGQTSRIALEFQVREDGNPIDPRAILGL